MSVLFYSFLFLIIIYSLKISVSQDYYVIRYDAFYYSNPYLNFFCVFAVTIYVFVRAISYDTGADYLAYYNYYISCVKGYVDSWGEGREEGFQCLINIFSLVFNSPNWYFALCALLGCGSLIYTSKRFGRAAPYIVYAWGLFMFNLSMNLYRQYMALALLMIVYGVLIKKTKRRVIIAICLVALAYSFHHSSVVGGFALLLIYFCRKRSVNKWLLIICCIISSVASVTILAGFFDMIGNYSDAYMAMNERNYLADEMLETMYDRSRLIYINLISEIIIIWYGDRVMKYDDNLRYLFYILAICYIITPLTQQEILMRMRLYLTNFMVIGYGVILYLNKTWFPFKTNIVLYCVVIYQFMYMFIYQNTLLFNEFPINFKL